MPTEESKLKSQCKDYLKLKGIDYIYHLQGIGSYKGIGDIQILWKGKSIFVEYKAKNNKISEYQQRFKEMCERNKIPYWVIRSVEELQTNLKSWKNL